MKAHRDIPILNLVLAVGVIVLVYTGRVPWIAAEAFLLGMVVPSGVTEWYRRDDKKKPTLP